jgi:ribosomal protein S27E
MADVSYGTSLLFAFFLLGLSFFSFISLAEFVHDGEIYVEFGVYPCITFLVVMTVATSVVNIAVARTVISSSTDPKALRAAYLLIGYPVILISFLFATIGTGFAPSIAFGLPLFATGMIAYPWASLIVRSEFFNLISANILRVQCYNCRYVFEMNRAQDQIRCPYCGEPNLNPLGPDPGEPPAEVALDVEAASVGGPSTDTSVLPRM